MHSCIAPRRISRIPSLGVAAALLLALAGPAGAQEGASDGATEVVERVKARVLSVIEEAKSYADEDPERYYDAVDEALDGAVDFRGFARGVMGPYASGKRYRSLDEQGQQELREQLETFTGVMRDGLIRTYSKGLLAFGGSRIGSGELIDSESDDRRASVRQQIFSDAEKPYTVVYQMYKDGDEGWLIRNMVVEGVNLGRIYRSQFEDAARRYDGDVDRVIANWDVENADALSDDAR